MKQSGDLDNNSVLNESVFMAILNDVIDKLDVKQIKEEAEKFVKTPEELSLWSKEFFYDLSRKIIFV